MASSTFRDFVERVWKESCYQRCKPSTRARMDSALQTQLLPVFGEQDLDRIRRTDVHLWFDAYSATAPGGANRTLDVLRQILSYAVACGHRRSNPARGVTRNPRVKPTRFLSRAEILRLHGALDAHRGRGPGQQQAEIIRLLLLTGCRRGELVKLRWSEVDGDVLRLRDAKAGPRTVFLNARARAVLARQPRTGAEFVFPSRDDPSRHRSAELSLWRKIRKQARIEDVRLHDLRHTFASYAVMRGVPLPVVSRLLGHSNTRMTLRYAHVSDRDTEAAAERVGEAIATLLTAPIAVQGHQDRTPDGQAASASLIPRARGTTCTAQLTPNCASRRLSDVMKTVNALKLRQSLGKVLDRLERDGEPIVVCRRRTPAAALVSLKDYRERFVDRDADERRRDVVARLKKLQFETPRTGTTLDVLRDLRS